jgi:hypothetical protein
VIVSLCGALACQIGYKNLNWTEDFVWDAQWQGPKSVCENSVLERHGFSRAVIR